MTLQQARRMQLTACLIALVSTIGIALPYPVLAPLLTGATEHPFGAGLDWPPKLLLGLALAVNPLGMLIGGLLFGRWSDRYGRRRLLTISLALGLLGHALSALALSRGSFSGFLLARLLTGFGEGNIAIARAVIADLHPLIHRSRAFGQLNSVVFIGWLSGPLIGGLALPLGQTVPFWIAAATLVPALWLTRYWLVESAPDPQAAALAPIQWRAHPGLRAVIVMQLCWTIGLNAFYEFYPLWLVEGSGYGSVAIGVITALCCLLMTASSAVLWPRWSARQGILPTAMVAGLGFIALLSLLPLFTGHSAALLIVLSGLPVALYGAAIPVYVSERYAELGQGRLMGLLLTVFCLGNLLIASGGGLLSLIDTRAVLWLGAGSCLLAWLQLWRLRRGLPAHTTLRPAEV